MRVTLSPLCLNFRNNSNIKGSNKKQDFLSEISKNYLKTTNKQILDDDTFFVDMFHYGQNKNWAAKMNNLTYEVSNLISGNVGFDEIMSFVEKEVSKINTQIDPIRYNWAKRLNVNFDTFAFDAKSRGKEYYYRYTYKILDKNGTYRAKSDERYPNANVCALLLHYGKIFINSNRADNKNFDFTKQEFEKLRSIKNPTQEQINNATATINWLMIQGTPYERGNDTVASVLTRAIYHAYDIEVSPLKPCISTDFEAYDTNLCDYVMNYPLFFKRKPQKRV